MTKVADFKTMILKSSYLDDYFNSKYLHLYVWMLFKVLAVTIPAFMHTSL